MPRKSSFPNRQSSIHKDFSHIAHKRGNACFKGTWRVYTLHLANRIAHSGSHGQTGAVYAGGALGLILLSKTAEVFCWVLQRKKRKCDSFPACLDAVIPFHEQRHFGTATTLGLHREPLKRRSQMSGRSICMVGGCVRGRSREPSGHRRTVRASMS